MPQPHPKIGSVSAVIPTRNRASSVHRLLSALSEQERRPEEVLVVDASDEPLDVAELGRSGTGLSITVLRTPAHLPSQRNHGIRASRGTYVFLCDDDIEPPPDYLRRLVTYLDEHPMAGAATGALRERSDEGGFAESFPAPSFRRLLFAFVFQLTVWGDLESVRAPAGLVPLLRGVQAWYRRRGNTRSLAGWPLVTQVRTAVVPTAVYGLGASVIRREWLGDAPYDERLGTHGIGDNYGVALGFPTAGITVLRDIEVFHHAEPTNRLSPDEVYYQRVLALDYFLRTERRRPGWSFLQPVILAWSLFGSACLFALQRNAPFARRAWRASGVVLMGRNPLLAPSPADVGDAAADAR